MVKDKNYITIQGWMTKLGLSSNKLVVFAIVYGFCQDDNSVFCGSGNYIASWLGTTKRTALDILNALADEGFLIKNEKILNGIKVCEYQVNKEKISAVEQQGRENISLGGGENISIGGGENISPNNNSIDNYSLDNIENKEKIQNINILYKKERKPREPEMIFGEFGNVRLTETELKKIIEKYEWYTEDAITTLDCYLETHGEKYKRHYPVFSKTNWIWPRVHNNPDCGIRPITNMVLDPTQQGGLRKETALEYYTKKYNLKGDENAGKENNLPLPD